MMEEGLSENFGPCSAEKSSLGILKVSITGYS